MGQPLVRLQGGLEKFHLDLVPLEWERWADTVMPVFVSMDE